MEIYDEIKRQCHLKGITIDELAKVIGITPAVYYGWRQRNMIPRADYLHNICKVLGVSMEHFFDDGKDYVVLEKIIPIVKKIETLTDEDIEFLNNLSATQIQSMLSFCKSMKR